MAAMDDDFDDLMDDIDFDLGDSKKKERPKNVVFATGLDVAEGIRDSLNPMSKISDIVRELMPDAVRSEYSDLETAIKEIKAETDKGLENVTNSLKDVSKAVSGLLPEGKIKEKLKEFGQKDTYYGEYKSKEQEQKEKINQAILEALGESQTEEKKSTLVKEALEEQRQANSQAVLKSVYAELKASNHFNSRITEKYYYKSLELQYKQLYKTSELVELTKVGWDANRKQMESIIINSSLPDMIKLRTLQATNDRRLKERAKQSYLGNYFKRFNPFENLTKNIKSNINMQFTMWNEALQAALMGADQAQSFRDQMGEFGGISPGTLIGMQIGEHIRSHTLGRLGNRLGQTRQGRRFVFNFKDFMADPRYFLQNQRNNIRGNGAMARLGRGLLGTLSGLAGAPSKKTTEFINENLDDAKAFDGRVHQAIVKVIPGLLTDIRAILKASTKVGDEEIANNRVYFDNRSGRFMSGDAIRQSMRSDMRAAIDNDGFKYYAQQLIGQLENNGATFTNKEKVKIARAIATFMMDTGTTAVSPRILQDERLHRLIGGATKTKLSNAASGLILQAYNDSYIMDEIKNQLEGMRRSLPNMNNRLQDLYRSGHMELAGNLVTQDARTGNYTLNDRSRDREIRRAIAGIDFGSDGGISGVSDDEVASAMDRTRQQVNEAFGFVRQTRAGRAFEGAVNRVVGSRTMRNARNLGSRAYTASGARAAVNTARNTANRVQDAIINVADMPEDQIIANLTSARTNIENLVSRENLRRKSPEIRKAIKKKFKDSKKALSKLNTDIRNKISNLSREDLNNMSETARQRALKIWEDAEKEASRLSQDFMQDLQDNGVDTNKLDDFKAKVESIRVAAESKIASDPVIQSERRSGGSANTGGIRNRIKGIPIPSNLGDIKELGKLAMKTKYGKAAKEKFDAVAGRLAGRFPGLFGGVGAQAATDANADLREGQDRFERQRIREQQDEQRAGSARNQFNQRRRLLEEADGNRRRSGFITKAFAKPLLFGGLGLVAITILKKLGFGMEDVIKYAKGMVSGISKVGAFVGSIFGGIKKILNKFGIGTGDIEPDLDGAQKEVDDLQKQESGDDSIGLGAKATLGAIAGYAGYKTYKFAKRVYNVAKTIGKIGLGAGKLAGKAAMGLGKFGLWAATGGGARGASLLRSTPPASQPGMISRGFSWLGNKLSTGVNAAKSAISKIPTPADIKKALSSVGEKIGKKFKPRMAKAILAKLARKLGIRGGMAVASAATASTGIGAPVAAVLGAISLGMLAYDVYGIGRRLIDGKSLGSAVSEHYLDFDVFDDNVTDETVAKDKEVIDADIEVASEEAKINGQNKATKEAQKIADKAMASVNKTPSVSVSTSVNEDNNLIVKTSYGAGGSNTANNNNIGFQQAINPLPRFPVATYTPPKNFIYEDISSVAGWYESRNRPGTVSKGTGDHGGVSYGEFQMTKGTLEGYLKQSRYGRYFKGLTIHSPEFRAKWIEVARIFGPGFRQDQKEYIKKTHYNPLVSKLASIGLYPEGRSDALKAMLFSMGVSMGPGLAFTKINQALNAYGISPISGSDEDIINAIYDHEAATVHKTYRSSSPAVQQSRATRAMEEKAMILSVLKNNPGKTGVTSNSSINTPAPETNPKTESSGNTGGSTTLATNNVVSGAAPSIQKASADTTVNTRSSGVINTSSTNSQFATQMVNILKQQLDVQNSMLKNLVQIATNTAIFGKYAEAQQEAQNNQPTQIPQPAISLERREQFYNI